jgi:hypothetical protein
MKDGLRIGRSLGADVGTHLAENALSAMCFPRLEVGLWKFGLGRINPVKRRSEKEK